MPNPVERSCARRMSWLRVVVVGCLLMGGIVTAQSARALVIQSYLLNGPDIPTLGVLKLADEHLDGVYDANEVRVPGQFVAANVWRPDAPFSPGSYEVRHVKDGTGFFAPGHFEAVATPMLDPGALRLAWSAWLEQEDVIEEACCEADPELFSRAFPECEGGADTCETQPGCAPLRYRQSLHVQPMLDSQLIPNELLWQLDVTEAEGSPTPTEGAEVDPSLARYCAALDVFNWVDQTNTRVEGCLEHEPGPNEDYVVPDFALDFGPIQECLLPPTGYQPGWCQSMQLYCVEWPALQTGVEYEHQLLLCSNFYELCQQSMPQPAPTMSAPPIVTQAMSSPPQEGTPLPAPGTPQGSPSTSPAAEPEPDSEAQGLRGVSEPSGGCALSLRPSSLGRSAWLVLLGALGAWVARRRQRAARSN